jgi:hypothetical protein
MTTTPSFARALAGFAVSISITTTLMVMLAAV